MPKLQRVTRPSGTERYSLYVDTIIIEEMGWKKGQVLLPEIVISKDGKKQVIIVEE